MVICQGDCNGVYANAVAPLFPKSVGFEAYIQPNTGHILTTAVSQGHLIFLNVLTVSSTMLREVIRSSPTTSRRMACDLLLSRPTT
jgi:hypothetical protein